MKLAFSIDHPDPELLQAEAAKVCCARPKNYDSRRIPRNPFHPATSSRAGQSNTPRENGSQGISENSNGLARRFDLISSQRRLSYLYKGLVPLPRLHPKRGGCLQKGLQVIAFPLTRVYRVAEDAQRARGRRGTPGQRIYIERAGASHFRPLDVQSL